MRYCVLTPLPSVVSYLPTGVFNQFTFLTARIEDGVGVVDVDKYLSGPSDGLQQCDCTLRPADGDMADGAGEGRAVLGIAQFGIAPEGAIDQNGIAGIVNRAQFVGDLGESRSEGNAASFRLQDKADAGFARRSRLILRIPIARIRSVERGAVRKWNWSSQNLSAEEKRSAWDDLNPGHLIGNPAQHPKEGVGFQYPTHCCRGVYDERLEFAEEQKPENLVQVGAGENDSRNRRTSLAVCVGRP